MSLLLCYLSVTEPVAKPALALGPENGVEGVIGFDGADNDTGRGFLSVNGGFFTA